MVLLPFPFLERWDLVGQLGESPREEDSTRIGCEKSAKPGSNRRKPQPLLSPAFKHRHHRCHDRCLLGLSEDVGLHIAQSHEIHGEWLVVETLLRNKRHRINGGVRPRFRPPGGYDRDSRLIAKKFARRQLAHQLRYVKTAPGVFLSGCCFVGWGRSEKVDYSNVPDFVG